MAKAMPEITSVWQRFAHRFGEVDNRIFQHGDTTTKFEDTARTLNYSHETGDIVTAIQLQSCTDECDHGDLDPNVSRLVSRPDGLMEIVPPEKKKPCREIEVFALDSAPVSASERKSWPDPTQLCNDCSNYDFSVLYPGIVTMNKERPDWEHVYLALAAIGRPSSILPFHKNFSELQESAKSCASCKVFLSALPDPDTFTSDNSRPTVLRVPDNGKNGMERSFWYLDIGFPAIDARHPARKVTRYGKVDVLAVYGDPAAEFLLGVAGRAVLPADSPSQPFRWINDCRENHATCKLDPAKQILPTRLIRVPTDATLDPWLEDGKGRADDYVALSYRWGAAKLSKTLLSNLSEYKKAIPFGELSKTIQDAIDMTRNLGFHYLWVDSLCIIQDSVDDWTQEASQMAAVYQNATLTFSASVCESADSGLFYQDPDDYLVPLKARTFEGEELASFCIASRSCSSFQSDVNQGTLSDRGWCLQERLLSRRILHFGASQTHWECLEGAWSANYGPKLANDPAQLRTKFQTGLQASIPRNGPASLMMPGAPLVKQRVSVSERESRKSEAPDTPQPRLRQLYGLEPHGTWYRMLMDYSARSLTQPTDKLAALAGLASAFAAKTGDIYLNGLWLHGLPEGLLWSSVGLGRGRYESKSRSKRTLVRRAPTWSWASFDGPISYPISKYSYVDAVVYAYSMSGPENSRCCRDMQNSILELHSSQRLVLKVMSLPLLELKGFKPEERKFLRENKDSRGAFLVPHAFWDDPEHDPDDVQDVMAFFIAQVGCGRTDCDHKADCGAGFASCLLVKKVEEEEGNVFRRVGIAQCISGDFIGTTKYFMTLI